MRKEIIRCDACKKEHDAQYVLPKEWITTKQRDEYGCDGEYSSDEKHFCSKTCLIKWASDEKEESKSVPITGIHLSYTGDHVILSVCKDDKWYKIIREVVNDDIGFTNMVTINYLQKLIKEENEVNI